MASTLRAPCSRASAQPLDFPTAPAATPADRGVAGREHDQIDGIESQLDNIGSALRHALWNNPVVHASSHFVFEAAQEAMSYLLLGDGSVRITAASSSPTAGSEPGLLRAVYSIPGSWDRCGPGEGLRTHSVVLPKEGRMMSATARAPQRSYSFLPVRDGWLKQWQEEILDPELPIVDSHHHLWDRRGWRYLLEEFRADVQSGHNIVATVFVECRSMYRNDGPEELRPVGETEFVNGVAAMSADGTYGPARFCAGIVGHADLRQGARVEPVLEAHVRAGNGRFRGIRHIAAWDADVVLVNPAYGPPPGLMADRGFREGFACLAPLGLSFDAALNHPQIDELASLADAFPDTRIVLDHVGSPLGIGPCAGRRAEVYQGWAASIRALSRRLNMFVKLGGLGMHISGFGFHELPRPPSSELLATEWGPYIETCIEAFGADRCMFESNFPVDKGSYGYAAFWNACKRLAQGATAAERAALFSGTAARFYRLAGIAA